MKYEGVCKHAISSLKRSVWKKSELDVPLMIGVVSGWTLKVQIGDGTFFVDRTRSYANTL